VRHHRARRAAMIGLSVLSTLALASNTLASTPGTDVRLSNDSPGTTGYMSNYTMVTGIPYTDATLTECSRSRGRENESAIAVNPRNTQVLVGSSNDYCGVYDNGVDANGAPIPSGPIWLGYYRSENGGTSFQSSLVPGYPNDTSPYAARAQIRTATAGDPVWAWDGDGRLFAGAEASGDPDLTKKTFGDVWVATFENPQGVAGPTINDGKEFKRSVIVARGVSAPNLLGKFQDKTAIEADRTTASPCRGNVYFANSRFTGNGGSNIYLYRSTNHGVSFSKGTLLTTSVNLVQDPEIVVTSNGHVYVTYDGLIHKGNSYQNVLLYNKSTNCGATFSPSRVLTTFNSFEYVDRPGEAQRPAEVGPKDEIGPEEEEAPGGTSRDCGDFQNACQSGYTFPRLDSAPRAQADQYAATTDETVYIVFEQSIPGTETPTGTTFGKVEPGVGSQGGVYFMTLNGATGATTTPRRIDTSNGAVGDQFWADISADGGVLHLIWYDTRNDPCYSRTRPVGNCAPVGSTHPIVAGLDVYATKSTNRGTTFAVSPGVSSVRLSDVTTNPDYEQFDGRTVPFNGDYIWVTSMGDFAFADWTDYRNVVGGVDQREAGDDDGDTGADVMQCRTQLPSGAFTGDTCPRAGGLDQDIYGDKAP
jgi:hypothetical protein